MVHRRGMSASYTLVFFPERIVVPRCVLSCALRQRTRAYVEGVKRLFTQTLDKRIMWRACFRLIKGSRESGVERLSSSSNVTFIPSGPLHYSVCVEYNHSLVVVC